MKPLEASFYTPDAVTVAKALLGHHIIREVDGKRYAFKIVETEAYMGAEDKGAHAYGNKKTPRTAPLFEEGGRTYIYLIYGMYYCLNLSANRKDIPQGVLIRGVEPVDEMALAYARGNRQIKSKKDADLTNGPGKLCKALQIDKSLNMLDATTIGPLWVTKGEVPVEIVSSKRINIPYAEEYQHKLWRFYIKDNPYVSVY